MPKTMHQRRPRAPGAWLSSEGPYQDLVTQTCQLNPNLAQPDLKNRWNTTYNSSVAMLEMHKDKTRRTDFVTSADLETHFRRSPSDASSRLYLLQGLAPDFVSVLGDFFSIDPSFFLEQERTSIWAYADWPGLTPSLPSLLKPSTEFQVRYFELRDFDSPMDFKMACAATGRHIGATKMDGIFDCTGIVRRKCSFWSRVRNGHWDALILCDPPVDFVYIGGADNLYQQPPTRLRIVNTPYQGGYRSFLPQPSRGSVPIGPPRTSMFDDLCIYWPHNLHLVDHAQAIDASLFAKKIMASHYMQLLEYFRSLLSKLEWRLSRHDDLAAFRIPWVEENWSTLQSLSRRCSEYCEDVDSAMLAMGIPFTEPDSTRGFSWLDSDIDFQYIRKRLREIKARFDTLVSAMTGLAGIAGNRQSLIEAKRSVREAKSVKTLTLLATVFIPLAYCCALLSMSDHYLPGSKAFWVYFAVSLPLIVVVFAAIFVIDLGYGDDGIWSIPTLHSKIFGSYRRSQAKSAS